MPLLPGQLTSFLESSVGQAATGLRDDSGRSGVRLRAPVRLSRLNLRGRVWEIVPGLVESGGSRLCARYAT